MSLIHHTGSSLHDEIAEARDRIRARMWRTPFAAPPPPPSPPVALPAPVPIFPSLPPQNIKTVEERVAEARELQGDLSIEEIKHIVGVIRRSAVEFESATEARPPAGPKVEDIIRLVASHFNVSRADILSTRRLMVIVRPRQIAMYLSKILTRRSLLEIGRLFGHRDHTTVLHSVQKIAALVEASWWFATEIETLKRTLVVGVDV